jgi:hypothetical protein
MSRLRVGLPVLAALLLASGWLVAQDAKKGDDREPIIVKRKSLPAGFKRLGLSPEQIKMIDKVRAQYGAKIEALQQQINDLKEKERSELYDVLTDAQKARLRELRATEPKTKEIKSEDTKKENK